MNSLTDDMLTFKIKVIYDRLSFPIAKRPKIVLLYSKGKNSVFDLEY